MNGFEKQRLANLISGISHCAGGDMSVFLKTVTRQIFENNKDDYDRLYNCLRDVYNSLIAAGFKHPPHRQGATLKDEPRGNLTHWWGEHGYCVICDANKERAQYLKDKIYTIYPKSK